MKNTKKIVAMALAVIMVFGVATTAFAENVQMDIDILTDKGLTKSPWVPSNDTTRNLSGGLKYTGSLNFYQQTWTSYWFLPDEYGRLEVELDIAWDQIAVPSPIYLNNTKLEVWACTGDAQSNSNIAKKKNISLPVDVSSGYVLFTGLDPNKEYFVFFKIAPSYGGNYLKGTCIIDWP